MTHPIFKPEPNIEYPLEMLAGPYGDNDTKGPVQGKYGPQWRYLVKVSDVAHYWYATPQVNEMLEELRLTSKGAPFTITRKTKDGKNIGFEISGQMYDDIFGDPRVPPEDSAPTEPGETEQFSGQAPLDKLEDRMGIFAGTVNEKLAALKDEIKQLDGKIKLVEKLVYDLGQPFENDTAGQTDKPPFDADDIPF